MRKLFLLIPVLAFALMANADVISIAPGTSLAYTVNDANPGDVIIMDDGLYPGEDQIKLVKDITIKAAANAHPVVQTTYYCELKSSAKVYIEGITFDGQNSTQQCIRTYDATAGKELHLNNCEFKNYQKDVISGDKKEYTLDSCVVTNCYFHNNTYSPIFFNRSNVAGKQTIYGLIVKNSTFANNDASPEYRSVIDVSSYASDDSHPDATDEIEVLIDHCTFYNNTTKNSDYSAVRTRIINNTTVSNCIFAHSSAIAFYATNVWAGNVTNCLAYNLSNGYMSGPTRTNTNTGDPLFNDLANNKYTYDGNWVTPSISPARGAATDGSDLGDPRWYSAEVLPNVDFASPYQFIGTKALLAGQIGLNANDNIEYYDTEDKGTATWKIHATRACVLNATLNMETGSSSGHIFKVEVLDADGNTVGELAEPSQSSHDGNIDLPGTLAIPAVGDYTVILYNLQTWSSAKLEGVTFTYVGGDVQAMPGTTNIADAWFSSNGTRADGKISYTSIGSGCWAKWNINVASAATYNVTVDISGQYGHEYTVEFLKEGESTPIVVHKAVNYTNDLTLYHNDLGSVELEAGNYEMTVSNSTGDAALHGVTLAYVGGTIQNIPGPITLTDAILSAKAYIESDMLYFAPHDCGTIPDEWAKWNLHVADANVYKFAVNVTSPENNGQKYQILILDSESNEVFRLAQASNIGSGDQSFTTDAMYLVSGDYTMEMRNIYPYSDGHLVSIAASVASNVLIVDEMATDMQYINDVNGQSMKPLLKRPFVANMYNTVVFPFNGVTDAELTEIFGDGYELLEMTSAVLDGNTLNLNFAAVDLSQDTYGRPYLIKPTQDVVNPMFSSKTIYKSISHLTVDGGNAEFIGSFIKGEVPAGEDNLFLGPDNTLYFSQNATPIKGMRAWFKVKGGAAGVAKRACIVLPNNVPTEIELVNSQEPAKSQKLLQDGQLIIIRDGVRYNVMGVMIK